MTRETLAALFFLALIFGPHVTRADTYSQAEPGPLVIPMCDPITGLPNVISGIMQPAARQYASAPILLDMDPVIVAPVGGGGRAVNPVDPVSPIPIPATVALLAPALALGLWLMTRRMRRA